MYNITYVWDYQEAQSYKSALNNAVINFLKSRLIDCVYIIIVIDIECVRSNIEVNARTHAMLCARPESHLNISFALNKNYNNAARSTLYTCTLEN